MPDVTQLVSDREGTETYTMYLDGCGGGEWEIRMFRMNRMNMQVHAAFVGVLNSRAEVEILQRMKANL